MLGDPDSGKSLPLPSTSPQNSPRGFVPFSAPTPSSTPSPLTPTPSATLLLAAEDEGPRDTLRPRPSKPPAADLPSIHRLPNFHSLVPPPHPTRLNPNPRTPSPASKPPCKANPAIKLLIIDSLPAFLGHTDHLNSQAPPQDPSIPRTPSSPSLAAIAEQYQIAILAITRPDQIGFPKTPPARGCWLARLHLSAPKSCPPPFEESRSRSPRLRSPPPDPPQAHPHRHSPHPRLPHHPRHRRPHPHLGIRPHPPSPPDQITQLHPTRSSAATKSPSPPPTGSPAPLSAGPPPSSKNPGKRTRPRKLHRSRHAEPRPRSTSAALSIKEGKPNKWWWKLVTDTTSIPPASAACPSPTPNQLNANLASNLRQLMALGALTKKS